MRLPTTSLYALVVLLAMPAAARAADARPACPLLSSEAASRAVGVQVAEDLLGVLAVIRFLLDHHVLMAAHIKPSRTRNLMVNLPALERWMATRPRRAIAA